MSKYALKISRAWNCPLVDAGLKGSDPNGTYPNGTYLNGTPKWHLAKLLRMPVFITSALASPLGPISKVTKEVSFL